MNNGCYDYFCLGNLICEVLENSIVQLENGYVGFVFLLGMVVILLVLFIFELGDEILVLYDMYGGIYCVLIWLFLKFGIKIIFVDIMKVEKVEEVIIKDMKVIYIESFLNLFLQVMDIKVVVSLVKECNFFIIVDNMFLIFYLQQLIDFGVNIVIYSVIKYISGYSDVIGGLVVVSDEKLVEEVKFV